MIPAQFVEELFEIELGEQLLETCSIYRHGRLIRILFSVRTTKQPPQPAISAATALMASSRACAAGSLQTDKQQTGVRTRRELAGI